MAPPEEQAERERAISGAVSLIYLLSHGFVDEKSPVGLVGQFAPG